jgi:hypothetical protein
MALARHVRTSHAAYWACTSGRLQIRILHSHSARPRPGPTLAAICALRVCFPTARACFYYPVLFDHAPPSPPRAVVYHVLYIAQPIGTPTTTTCVISDQQGRCRWQIRQHARVVWGCIVPIEANNTPTWHIQATQNDNNRPPLP